MVLAGGCLERVGTGFCLYGGVGSNDSGDSVEGVTNNTRTSPPFERTNTSNP